MRHAALRYSKVEGSFPIRMSDNDKLSTVYAYTGSQAFYQCKGY